MNFINKKKLIVCVIIFFNIAYEVNSNTIIFKLNDIIYTSEDLEKRINYIKLKDQIIDISEYKVKKEYINALIFNEFGNRKIKIKNTLIEDYYKEFFDQYQNIKKNNLLYDAYQSITYEEILSNLKIDLIRKILLEDLLNNNYKGKNKILDKIKIDDIYEKFFKYISFNKKNYDLVNEKNINIDLMNIQKTIDELNINKIEYIYEIKKILKIEDTSIEIQKSFASNDEFVKLNIGNNIIIGQIIKTIKFEKEINFNLLKIEIINEDINYNDLKCEEILNNDIFNYTEINNLKFNTLNKGIKENLKNINDKIILNESSKKFIIMLCNINYNEDFFKNYKLNSQVNLIVNDMEEEFIKKYSAIYNLEVNNE